MQRPAGCRAVRGVQALLGEFGVELDLAALDGPVGQQLRPFQQLLDDRADGFLCHLQRRRLHEDLEQGPAWIHGHDALADIDLDTVRPLDGLDGIDSVLQQRGGPRSLQRIQLRRPLRDARVHAHDVCHDDSVAGQPPRPQGNDRVVRRLTLRYCVAGARKEADRSFARARSLIEEGPPEDAPPWAWWVSAREIDRQHGRVLSTVGRWREAIPVLRRASDERQGVHVGCGIASNVWLLDSLLHVEAWDEARETAEALIPAVAEVSSIATLNTLRRVVSTDAADRAPSDLRDALWYLRDSTTDPLA
ncbi:hypothetical protein ACWGJ2_24295 [Streptomyces sp. NPDC054796]